LGRIKETESRLPSHEEELRQAQAQAQRLADEEVQRLSKLEEACKQAEAEAAERAAREQALNERLAQIKQQSDSRQDLTELEELCLQAEAEAAERAAREQALSEGLAQINQPSDSPQDLTELEELCRQAEAEVGNYAAQEQRLRERLAQLKQEIDPQRIADLEAACKQAEAEVEESARKQQSLNERYQELQEQKTAVREGVFETNASTELIPNVTSTEIEPYLKPVEEPWLTIDLNHQTPVTTSGIELFVAADATADLSIPETVPVVPVPPDPTATIFAQSHTRGVPASIAERLQSPQSTDRAAALVDLADTGGDDAYALITKSFDDPSAEVRNAAARALHSLQPDLAASFTRALREASPERRRKIGSAIAGSGLAANAINSLSGEGRDRTYDAFSILFLMAKAGEVQPLMQAIAKHPNTEVRLTAVKLLALSKQQQILPGLRNLAARDALPAEVHAAVMEAIYLLSNQSREVA
jgi:hypothetical protein